MLDTISDVVHGLQNYLKEIEFNPKRLDEVEERLGPIHSTHTQIWRANFCGAFLMALMPVNSWKP
ncbi:hypothetical protein [Candidatus Villigracilis affinis]|uniref:hypothetical protein n=1 Tax=Candidatus Villigracilis affinis TaxID=3140682 RepID=UPI002A1BDB5B|nr:hypothetical protein [Anaerolineales bacterium]